MPSDSSPSFFDKPSLTANSTSRWDGLPISLSYILLSIAFIPLIGLQEDESLFTNPIYLGMTRHVRLFHHDIQLMVMSYIGTLKTFLWIPILNAFGGNVWSARLPAVILSAGTVFMFHRLMRLAGFSRVMAVLGAVLLATDPTFLLTNTVDWGPVMLEHFLLVAGCCLLLEYVHRPSRLYLFFGFLCLGMALWNKTVFVWALAGLITAALAVFPREILARLSRQSVLLAAAGFLMGASPLLVYNGLNRSITLRENVHFDTVASATAKWRQLTNTLNGNGLFGYMVEEESSENPKPAESALGRISTWVREQTGSHRTTGFYWVLGAMLLVFPVWWRSRAAWFALTVCCVAWLAMAFTHDAGASVHHTVLLWPFPILFAAAVLSSIRVKWLPVAIGISLAGMNCLVLNQYLFQFERFGAATVFTDAIYPLSKALPDGPRIFVTDWGMVNTLMMLHNHQGVFAMALDPFTTDAPLTEPQIDQGLRILADPQAMFIGHVKSKEVFEGVGRRLESFAVARGWHKEVLQTVPDSNGRPMFEIYKFQKL